MTRMSLRWTTWKNWLSVAVWTFIGGAAMYLSVADADTVLTHWKRFAIGAALAGVIAVAHLGQIPKPIATTEPRTLN